MIAIAASASDCNDDNNDGSNRAVEVVAIAMTMIAKMIVVVAISKLSPSLKRKDCGIVEMATVMMVMSI